MNSQPSTTSLSSKFTFDEIPYHSLFDTLTAQLIQQGDRVIDPNFLEVRPEQKQTFTELALELNLLYESLQPQAFNSEWNTGVDKYFLHIESFLKTLPNFEELKHTCLVYRLMKLEENINWDFVDETEPEVQPEIVENQTEFEEIQKVNPDKSQEESKFKKFFSPVSEKIDNFSGKLDIQGKIDGLTEKIGGFTDDLTKKISKSESSATFTVADENQLRREGRIIWREEWRERCLSKINILLLSMILIQAVNDYKYFIKIDFSEFSDKIDEAVQELTNTASEVEKVTKKTGIAKITAGGAGIVAAGAGVGVILAPFTGGASLAFAMTATSMTAGLAAGATNLGSTIVKNKKTQEAVTSCQSKTEETIEKSLILKELINDTATTSCLRLNPGGSRLTNKAEKL